MSNSHIISNQVSIEQIELHNRAIEYAKSIIPMFDNIVKNSTNSARYTSSTNSARYTSSTNSTNSTNSADTVGEHAISFSDLMTNFRILNEFKIREYYSMLNILINDWEAFKREQSNSNKPQFLKRKMTIRKQYNCYVNKLHQCLNEDSILNNLLFINKSLKLEAPSEPKIKTRIDVSTLEQKESDSIVVNLNRGTKHKSESSGCIFTDSYENARIRILACLENARPNDLIITNSSQITKRKNSNVIYFNNSGNDSFQVGKDLFSWGFGFAYEIGIKIPIFHADPETCRLNGNESFAYSNDPKIIQLFFDGVYPTKKIIRKLSNINDLSGIEREMYKEFIVFYDAMRRKIKELISISRMINGTIGSQYICVDCPRITPACGNIEIIRNNSAQGYISTPVTCRECRMEICPRGCGKIYHGNSPCSASLDEASAAFISETTKTCPSCSEGVFKQEGCNHMTCRCRCQFCYVCGQEFARDSRGIYMVTEHFSDNGFGATGVRCRQFS